MTKYPYLSPSSTIQYDDSDWGRILERQFLPGQVSLATGNLGGSVEPAICVGPLQITHLSVQPQTITHTAQHLAALPTDDRAAVLAHILVEGEGFIEQGGAALGFRAGDLSFRNLQQASRVVFQTPGRLVAVRLPPGVLHWHQTGRAASSRAAPRVVASGGLLGYLPAPQRTALGNLYSGFALPWLFAAAYHSGEPEPGPGAPPNTTRWQQVLAYVEAHLFEAQALSPARCAQAVGISERYLHRLASLRGNTFSRLIKHRRLDAARALLEHPASRSLSVATVAYQCGFTDPAHFSRAFRDRFGQSPRQSRADRGAGQ